MARTESEKKAAEPEKKMETNEQEEAIPVENVFDVVRDQCRLLERGASSKESRYVQRALRAVTRIRKQLVEEEEVLKVVHAFASPSEQKTLAHFITDQASMDTDGAKAAKSGRSQGVVAEVDCYVHLLVLIYLLDTSSESALACAEALAEKTSSHNRRTLDPLAAKAIFYLVQSKERSCGDIKQLRHFLHARLRTATLRNDVENQAVVINALLRSYVASHLYDQADRLIQKTSFPENASNNEWARYLYYLGRIKAIQLEYTLANKHLVQSLRKAPQNTALGFRTIVQKLSVTVELLLGNIPERSIFLHKHNRKALSPYLQLTQAVRTGDVKLFEQVVQKFSKDFEKDGTYSLIVRLHHNVIKTAVRTISLAYSRIALADVAQKLGLESAEDAEYIVAKAIRDGVIEAALDPETGCMTSKEQLDIYTTREPQLAFHNRIEFCLDLHNSSVKAMRFPPKSYKDELESAEERREREAQDLELAKEMAEDDDDIL